MFALEPVLRRDIVATGKQLAERGFVTGTYGSISGRLDRDLVLCTRCGVAKGSLAPEEILKVSLGGSVVLAVATPLRRFPYTRLFTREQTPGP